MPVFLKDVKRELESDLGKVGRNPDGSYKFVPPNIVGRKVRSYTKLSVSKITKRVLQNLEAISFSGLVSSESEPGTKYKVTIRFHDMVFKQLGSKQFFHKVDFKLDGKDTEAFHRTPAIERNPVMMRCQCPDWRHRFEHQLDKANGLIGGPRKYTRKTPNWPTGRPKVNSTDKLGICKHISSMLLVLKDIKDIKER